MYRGDLRGESLVGLDDKPFRIDQQKGFAVIFEHARQRAIPVRC